MRNMQKSKIKKYKWLHQNKSRHKKIEEMINVDYMSNPFRPKYSDMIKSINLELGSTKIRKVINSQYDLYAEISHTKRSKAVRLIENLLYDVKGMLPDKFEMPGVVVLDFDIFNVGKDAIGGYDKVNNIMYINSRYNTRGKILDYLQRNKGFFASTTIYAPILHELGHKYYYDMIRKYSNHKNISYNEAEQIIRDKIADYVHLNNFDGFFLEKNLSKYAHDGYNNGKYSEIIAEAFSATDSKKVAKEIIDLIGGILL